MTHSFHQNRCPYDRKQLSTATSTSQHDETEVMTFLNSVQLDGIAPRRHRCDSEEENGVLLSVGLQVNDSQMDEFINNMYLYREQSPS
jgi:hypothetical protein